MSQPRLNLTNLQTSISRLIDEVRRLNGSDEITLTHDLYWKIEPQEKYDMAKEPGSFLTGNLADDIECTEWIDDSYERIGLYALSEVAEILSALAEESLRHDSRRTF